jgi:uncharacterized protein (TIGR03083 family)
VSPAALDDDALKAGLEAEAHRLGAVPPEMFDVDVPSCPGWTIGTLVGHVGEVHRWGAELAADPEATLRRRDVRAPEGAALAPWYAQGLSIVRAAFGDADLDVPVRTWAGTRPRRWWLRRLAHETALHRWDADHALGRTVGLEPRLAVDAIDELFDVFVPARFDVAAFGGQGETWHLHATDVDGEWLVRFAPERVTISREHAKGDCATRGPAAALLLLLWGRLTPGPDHDGVELFGDRSIIDHWQAAARF